MVSFFKSKKTTFRSVFANNSVFNLHFMKVSTENDNNFGYEKITIVVDNIPLNYDDLTVSIQAAYYHWWKTTKCLNWLFYAELKA
jgi:hypothetical protein